MSDFLTLEDINTTIFNNKTFWSEEIDFSQLPNEDFTNLKYGFCKITRITDGDVITYYFKIENSYWSKGFYVLNDEGIIGDFDWAMSLPEEENEYDIWIRPYEPLHLFLYMGQLFLSVPTQIVSLPKEYYRNMDYEELNTPQDMELIYLIDGESMWFTDVTFVKGMNHIERLSSAYSVYVWVNLIKSDFVFNCNQNLILGKNNEVALGTDIKYKPNGAMIGNNAPNITVEYNNQTLEVNYDNELNDYVFNLDLTDIANPQNIKFKVIIERNKVINNTETDVTLFADYQTISTYADLNSACQIANANNTFKLGADITLTDNISVSHSIKMIGANHTINLNEHNFELLEDVHFIAENLILDSGDSAIFLNTNSKLTLNNCKFINCISTNYNGLGSCIYCDVDFENLSLADDFEINLNNCYFLNNHSNIFSGGLLNIDKCKFRNNDISVVDKNNTAFIYQTDGTATITNSIFDIDYTSTSLCTNEKNIGFAQTIIMCGETATINGATYTDLAKDGSINLFGNDYNNLSHLFVKYYYPQIETCVFSSPYGGFEALSCCHSVSGLDWVFKDNVQVTRASWNTENTNRKIRWED